MVHSKNKKRLGVVVKAYQNDDSDDSDDSFDDDDEAEKVEEGKVLIGWYSLNPKWTDKDVEVVDEESVSFSVMVCHGMVYSGISTR